MVRGHGRAKKEPDTSKKIRIAFGIFMLLAAVILTRLFFLQVVSGAYYKTQSYRQQNLSQEKSPRRGNIYMRKKSGKLITLAATKDGYLAFLNNRKLKNPEEALQKLSAIIPVNRETFNKAAAKTADPYEVVAPKVERAEAEKIRALGIEGLEVAPEEWRSYPGKKLAAHVAGFVGYNGDRLEGRYGIERYFENALKGQEGFAKTSATGGFLTQLGKNLLSPPTEGYDIVLTLEPSVQAFLERILERAREQYQPTGGGAVIIEPGTGKIIAMAAFPTFDPNAYEKTEELGVFINPLVESVFEFGSVFKPLTMASGLNERVVTPETTYFDSGKLTLDGYTISNFDGKGRGRATMQEVLEQSLNTGAAFVAQKLGKENLRKYFTDFGLGEKTGVTLPGEVAGQIGNLKSRQDIEYATASFGQGISVTPLEYASATAALANGGKLMKPYLVERIVRPGREDLVTKPEVVREVVRPETAETISRMLVQVVDKALLNGQVKSKNYTMAAKTGTAQIPLENAKGYSEEYLHSFMGYAPGFDTRFLVFMYIQKPQGVRYASYSLGPYFEELMHFLLTYYEVPPDRALPAPAPTAGN